jgi:hypothetical protein
MALLDWACEEALEMCCTTVSYTMSKNSLPKASWDTDDTCAKSLNVIHLLHTHCRPLVHRLGPYVYPKAMHCLIVPQ